MDDNEFYEFLEKIGLFYAGEKHMPGEQSKIMLNHLVQARMLLGIDCAEQAYSIIDVLRHLSPETKQKVIEEIQNYRQSDRNY